jgi:hypothetical protein
VSTAKSGLLIFINGRKRNELILRAFVFPKGSLSNMIFFVTTYTAAIPMKRQVVYSFAAPYTRKTLLARQLDKCPRL